MTQSKAIAMTITLLVVISFAVSVAFFVEWNEKRLTQLTIAVVAIVTIILLGHTIC